MGKRGLLAALALAALLLAGCGGPNPPEGTPGGGSQSVTESGGYLPLEELVSGDQKLTRAGTAEGMYLIRLDLAQNAQNILYVDYAGRTAVPLCSQANCAHDSDSCTSWLGKMSSAHMLFLLRDRLYLVRQGGEESLWEAQPNGQERRRLFQLENNQFFAYGGIAGNEQYLFFKMGEINPSSGELRTFLCRYDFSSGSLQRIYNCDGENDLIVGVLGDRLLIQHYATAAGGEDPGAGTVQLCAVS